LKNPKKIALLYAVGNIPGQDSGGRKISFVCTAGNYAIN
jgi:hypothetical protein